MKRSIKFFLISEFFMASAWNSVIPIFSVFAIKAVPGSNINLATTAFSVYVAVRILVEISCMRWFSTLKSNRARLLLAISGIAIICLGYIGFAFTTSPQFSYFFYGLLGLGVGLNVPPKMAFFSSSMVSGTETKLWTLYDISSMTGSAIAALIAGLIIYTLGFQTLFAIAAIVNLISALPYILLVDDPEIL